ncbi:hypothetical protein N7495_008646 [Penicillium taxi]|uniref:uncharacterized protein n=1 Tax=Penicillium taxi TaxID=168475 RepID=UPI0025458DBB|nr:uncharacterized protein N7495_008646 [Penicillium taxi]KAJ5888605.1 hypothetical protein N7495_008646 [Penicillium taxi]
MSEPGPESIPTSADPRSKRPTKRRAMTPRSEHASQVESLFKDPSKEIKLPETAKNRAVAALSAPPEIVTNVQGSSAGAGSGEFHVYKASRRREQERLRLMQAEIDQEKDQSEWERQRQETKRKDEEKTEKNRRRRQKKRNTRGKNGTDGVMDVDSSAPVKGPMAPGQLMDTSTSNGDNSGNYVEEVPGVIIHDD